MAQEILVALKSEDRLSQMVPYIEKIAQPGMRVVLLIRFVHQTVFKASRHDSIELECPEESAHFHGVFAAERGTVSLEEQRLSLEHKVFLALEALRKRGIEIAVDVYMGSLRKAVKNHTRKGDVHFIVMRARREPAAAFFDKALPLFGLFKHSTFAPVLVLQPTHAV
ncbi:MAG TPA: hypothetical protein VEG60_24255 [Candidatus Binatia bacterium]|nr:hypothetical protein [Candidatus Binatia bacterium]